MLRLLSLILEGDSVIFYALGVCPEYDKSILNTVKF